MEEMISKEIVRTSIQDRINEATNYWEEAKRVNNKELMHLWSAVNTQMVCLAMTLDVKVSVPN